MTQKFRYGTFQRTNLFGTGFRRSVMYDCMERQQFKIRPVFHYHASSFKKSV